MDELDEAIPREEYRSPPAARRPWHDRPLVLGLLGLALMVGGWKLSTHVPAAPSDPRLSELHSLGADDAEYQSRLRAFGATPPYQLPGRLVLLAGLLVFGYAGVRMAQASL